MIHLALFGIDTGLSALLTYLVHSTASIAAALLLTRMQRLLSPAARHVVWRAALALPLASSALVLGLSHRWQWALTPPSPADEVWVTALAPNDALSPNAALTLAGSVERARASAPLGVEVAQPNFWQPWFAQSWSWSALLVAGWAVVALLGVVLIARGAARQRRALEPRTPITDAGCLEALERVAQRAGLRHRVRLRCCAGAHTPLVLNTREICLPPRALTLDRSALEGVLAHELAHIERRDTLWLNGALLLQALLWFQPLHRKVRAELRATAELAADDRAVELTGDALGLARTLTEVASWVSGARFVPSVAMARSGSPIVERVERLVEASDARTQARFRPRTPWLALAALAAIGASSPSVGAPEPEQPHPTLAPATPDTSAKTPPVPLAVSKPPPALKQPADTGNARRIKLADADRAHVLEPLRTSPSYWREQMTLESVLCQHITEAELTTVLSNLMNRHPDSAWGEAFDETVERFFESFARAGDLETEHEPPLGVRLESSN